jgi:putative heme transporter
VGLRDQAALGDQSREGEDRRREGRGHPRRLRARHRDRRGRRRDRHRGLAILQVPLYLPLAIIVFIGAFIPIVGATGAGIIAALVALVTNDLTTALWVTAIVVGVNQLEGNLLAPVVLGRSLKLNGLVVLLALTAGTILGGIVGTLLSVPLTAVAWAIITSWSRTEVPVPGLDGPQSARDAGVRRRSR